MKSVDVMIDLETLGLSAGCVILSIGASTFDLQNNFYAKIKIEDSNEQGFLTNVETMNWWQKQDKAAREEAFSGIESVINVLGNFSDWLLTVSRLYEGEVFVWGNGADFDLPILQAYYDKMNMKRPWKPYNGRCYRTLKNLYKDVKAPERDWREKHNALEDAVFQAKHARKILGSHFNKI